MIYKLRFLDQICEEKVDFNKIMKEVYTYNRWKFWKIFDFIRFFRKMQAQIEEIKQIDPKKARVNEESLIKKPQNVDNITFIAMMELQTLLGKDNSEEKIGQLMTEIISIVCFSSNNEQDFDIDSIEFKNFREKILDENLFDMLGLYNWIDSSLEQSELNWKKLFFEVEFPDKDYSSAGGEGMNQFNVINTIKSICTDFNLKFNEALQFDYGLTQINSLSKAKQAHIQHLMTKIAEDRMKRQR
jgi:hypothetical protein